MSSLIIASAFDPLLFCYKASAWQGPGSEYSAKFTLVGFDWDVVADRRCAVSEPGWNVGLTPVDRTGSESLLHSREIEVPCAVKELVCLVPLFAPLPAGMLDPHLGQSFNSFNVNI